MDQPSFLPDECDVVMEGGITSGVVYPTFIAALAGRFRLRSIAGTSVGAVAAVTAAAAQYRKNAPADAGGAPGDGFDALRGLPEWLGAPGSAGKSNLFSLFQPCRDLRRHFRVAQAALNARGAPAAVGRLTVALVCAFPLGAALALLPLWIALGWPAAGPLNWLCALGCALVALLLGAVVEMLITGWRGLARNRMGICSGMSNGRGAGPALTDWLYDYVQQLAGRPPAQPLTFGNLAGSTPSIDLALTTTGLSELRCHRLPYDSEDLVFSLSELAPLFPPALLQWMTARALPLTQLGQQRASVERVLRARDAAYGTPGQDLFLMPRPDDLPIVFAARMSLSFPVLLQAVPLYRLRHVPDTVGVTLARLWFSDGGLTSNFPIHYFDAILPGRPTFGITLSNSLRPGDGAEKRCTLPDNNLGGITAPYQRIDCADGLPAPDGFVAALLAAMRTWRHETQRRAPGYRDRVVRVFHTKEEGGLNLNMPKLAIDAMSLSGTQAAHAIIACFLAPDYATNGWVNHRWVRLRTAVALYEQTLEEAERVYDQAAPLPSYRQMWNAEGGDALKAYPLTEQQRRDGDVFLSALTSAAAATDGVLQQGVPRPKPTLAIAPKQV